MLLGGNGRMRSESAGCDQFGSRVAGCRRKPLLILKEWLPQKLSLEIKHQGSEVISTPNWELSRRTFPCRVPWFRNHCYLLWSLWHTQRCFLFLCLSAHSPASVIIEVILKCTTLPPTSPSSTLQFLSYWASLGWRLIMFGCQYPSASCISLQFWATVSW